MVTRAGSRDKPQYPEQDINASDNRLLGWGSLG